MKENKYKNQVSLISGIVCRKFNITQCDLNGKSRKAEIIKARQIAWAILRYNTKNFYSLERIGMDVGMKDHSTVLFGINKVQNYLSYDAEYKALYCEIFSEFNTALAASKFRQKKVNECTNEQFIIQGLTDALRSRSSVHMRISIREIISSLRNSTIIL